MPPHKQIIERFLCVFARVLVIYSTSDLSIEIIDARVYLSVVRVIRTDSIKCRDDGKCCCGFTESRMTHLEKRNLVTFISPKWMQSLVP